MCCHLSDFRMEIQVETRYSRPVVLMACWGLVEVASLGGGTRAHPARQGCHCRLGRRVDRGPCRRPAIGSYEILLVRGTRNRYGVFDRKGVFGVSQPGELGRDERKAKG